MAFGHFGNPLGHFFDPVLFTAELLFTVAAVIFCFAIYYKTRESYELTKYEGIKYFRDAFLFFGLSYVTRFLFSLLLLSRVAFDIILLQNIFVPLFILPLGYFSTIAISYLIFSLIWKRYKNKYLIVFGHGVAVLLPLVSFLTRSHAILLVLQSLLLVTAVILALLMHKEGKKVTQVRILYFLVLALWLINLWMIGPRRLFTVKISSQVISLIVFVTLYQKIAKWVK